MRKIKLNNLIKGLLLLGFLIVVNLSYSQDSIGSRSPETVPDLFDDEEILPVKLSYSNKDIRTKTNDSTYITTDLSYQLSNGSWKTLEVEIRARGHMRRETCYFTPIKIKIKDSERKGTIFEVHKKLKLVLPCLVEQEKNDKLLREYLAYRLYADVATYYYKTRLLDIDFKELKKKKVKNFRLKGFLMEDIDRIADRAGGKEIKDRRIHPFEQDDHASAQADIFQYMIGNTDFSNAYQHNAKLIFVYGMKTIPVPYDFDLSGLVNASYAFVAEVGNQTMPISSVTERLFRGYQRNEEVFLKVRKEYLAKKSNMLAAIDRLQPHFDNIQEYKTAKLYISDFFRIIEDESKFRKEIINRARTK